jgi:transposase
LRWAVLKRGEFEHLTTNQLQALAEIIDQGLDTATAWRIKEKLAWIRKAQTPRAARWCITHFLNWAGALVGDTCGLEPMRKALATLKNHIDRVVQRWTPNYTNARLEGMNGLFQAARARARGYRNTDTFITMIYLIGSPAGSILKST